MMKWLPLSCVVLLTISAIPAPARAQGELQLAWNVCKSTGGVSDVSFPCGGGDGTPKATLIGTFDHAPHQPQLVAMDGQVDLYTESALPDFLKFATMAEPTNCNPGIQLGDERPVSCTNAGSLCGSVPPGSECDVVFGVLTQASTPSLNPNRARMLFSVFRTSTIDAAANTEYFVFKIDFFADMAVESGGTCSGCNAGASFVFDRLGLLAPYVPGNTDYELYNPDCAQWNSGTSVCYVVPTRNTTWGALKSMYR